MAIPILRVGLPEIFLTISILDALELSSLLRYDDGEIFVFLFYHNRLLLYIVIILGANIRKVENRTKDFNLFYAETEDLCNTLYL